MRDRSPVTNTLLYQIRVKNLGEGGRGVVHILHLYAKNLEE
jgi:hypothetical protein